MHTFGSKECFLGYIYAAMYIYLAMFPLICLHFLNLRIFNSSYILCHKYANLMGGTKLDLMRDLCCQLLLSFIDYSILKFLAAFYCSEP